MIVVGNDALALEVCREFALTHRVAIVADPNEEGALEGAGIDDAAAVIAVSADDGVNLDITLRARALNPDVRIVLSQFSRGLGQKLEQNISNCSVISPAAHSAATFAAAALDPRCFYGVEFPEGSGKLVGFVANRASDIIPIRGVSVETAETYTESPILACNGRAIEDRGQIVQSDDEVVTFRAVDRVAGAKAHRVARRFLWRVFNPIFTLFKELDPLVIAAVVAGIGVFLAATAYFSVELKLGLITTAYFVVQTLTTVGYGDISMLDRPDALKLVDIGLMTSGVVLTNLAVAFLSAALVRTQWIALQGLRRVHASDHVLVCGAGRVGTRVVEYLHGLNLSLVIIERHPTPAAVRFGRRGRIALMTGDAAEDETLDHCDIERARAVVVLTDNDTANLEVGLGVRARQTEIPLIMRVNDARFAERIRMQFGIRTIFSPVALSAPTIVALASSPNARGRIAFGDTAFAIEETARDEALPDGAILLATSGDRTLRLVKAAS